MFIGINDFWTKISVIEFYSLSSDTDAFLLLTRYHLQILGSETTSHIYNKLEIEVLGKICSKQL